MHPGTFLNPDAWDSDSDSDASILEYHTKVCGIVPGRIPMGLPYPDSDSSGVDSDSDSDADAESQYGPVSMSDTDDEIEVTSETAAPARVPREQNQSLEPVPDLTFFGHYGATGTMVAPVISNVEKLFEHWWCEKEW